MDRPQNLDASSAPRPNGRNIVSQVMQGLAEPPSSGPLKRRALMMSASIPDGQPEGLVQLDTTHAAEMGDHLTYLAIYPPQPMYHHHPQTPTVYDLYVNLSTKYRVHTTWFGPNPLVPVRSGSPPDSVNNRPIRGSSSTDSLPRLSSLTVSSPGMGRALTTTTTTSGGSHPPSPPTIPTSASSESIVPHTFSRSASGYLHRSTNGTESPGSRRSVAEISSTDAVPTHDLEALVGLSRLTERLHRMISAYTDPNTRFLFAPRTAPDRKLYVMSTKGSGVHTAVSGVCKRAGVNLLRVQIPTDISWTDDFFAMLLDYAIAIKPCVILFDRCDFWFMNTREVQGYHLRGRFFEYAYRAHPTIECGAEDVWFIFSMSRPLSQMPENFQMLVGPRNETHIDPLQVEQVVECLRYEFKKRLESIQQAALDAHPTIQDRTRGYFATAFMSLMQHCGTIGPQFSLYTPGMIHEYVENVFAAARNRVLDAARADRAAADLYQLIPTGPEIDRVYRTARIITSGCLIMESSPEARAARQAAAEEEVRRTHDAAKAEADAALMHARLYETSAALAGQPE